jgi:hypothetical protein
MFAQHDPGSVFLKIQASFSKTAGMVRTPGETIDNATGAAGAVLYGTDDQQQRMSVSILFFAMPVTHDTSPK